MDSSYFVVDEITQMPPHSMDPGPLCDYAGMPYEHQPKISFKDPTLDELDLCEEQARRAGFQCETSSDNSSSLRT